MLSDQQKQLERKQLDFVLKLNRLTHEGKVQWRRLDDSTSSHEKYGMDYKALFFAFRTFSSGDTWAYSLEIYDLDSKPSLVITDVPALQDLHKTIVSKLISMNIQKLEELDALLSEDA